MKRTFTIKLFLIFLPVFFSYALTAQKITGIVKDAGGETLPGVNVMEKGTTNGSITNIDGRYTINVSDDNATLVFSYIGYATREIPLDGKTTIDITLEEKSTILDEIVVIGYGTMRKRDLTGAVASVNAQQLKDIPVTSAAAALTGRLAGVHVTTAEGSPDAEIKIRVRGGGSITQDNSPLLIVDGFPVSSISDIPPSDIQSIDVLKDASSTAIYGARGANGVVIITTKSGKAGQTEVSYNFFYGVKEIVNYMDVLDPYEFVLFQYERSRGSFLDERSFLESWGPWDQLYSLYKEAPGTNWQKEVFGRKAHTSYHNLSIRGGSENSNYSLSISRNNDEGIQMESGYVRNNINFRFATDASDRLRFNFDTRISDVDVLGSGTSDPGTSSTNKLRHSVLYRPTNGLYDFTEDPDFIFDEDEFYEASQLTDPVTLTHDDFREQRRGDINFNGSLAYKIIPDLKFTTKLGYRNYSRRDDRFYGLSTSTARKNADLPLASIRHYTSNRVRLVNTLNYTNRNLKDKHSLDFLLGQEMILSNTRDNKMTSRYFPENITSEVAFGSMALGEEILKPETFEYKSSMLSFFARANYSYLGRYLSTFSFRADGSSKFGKENRFGYFPAASVAWRISEEEFMSRAAFISNLKLRVSYGAAGNDRLPEYLYDNVFRVNGASKPYYINEVPYSYLEPEWLANPTLKWESMVTRNVGLDFGLFQNRFNTTVDMYLNTTKDLLMNQTIPPSSGYDTQMKNIGQTSNYGVEVVIDAYIIEKKDFKLSANFNIAMNKNRVDNLGGTEQLLIASLWTRDAGADYILRVGEPVGLMYGFVTDGYYTVDDFNYDPVSNSYSLKEGVADNANISFTNFGPGTLKFKDIASPVDENGNPVYDGNLITFEEDRVIIGNANPKHIGGLNIMAQYKGFDCSLFLNWVYGNDIYNANKIEFSSGYRTYSNLLSTVGSDKRWTTINELGEIVTDPDELTALNKDAEIWQPSRGRYLFHSWAVEDGSFLRINNITVGYSLPRQWINKLFIKNLRFYGTINNVYTFTNYTGYDPEVSTRTKTPLTPGVDYSAYPRSRNYILGLNVTF